MTNENIPTLLSNIPPDYLALLQPDTSEQGFLQSSIVLNQLFQTEDTNPETLRQVAGAYQNYSLQAIEDFDNLHRKGEGTRTLFQRARKSDSQHPHFRGLQLAVELYTEEREKGPASKDAWVIYQIMHRRNVQHITSYIPQQPEATTP